MVHWQLHIFQGLQVTQRHKRKLLTTLFQTTSEPRRLRPVKITLKPLSVMLIMLQNNNACSQWKKSTVRKKSNRMKPHQSVFKTQCLFLVALRADEEKTATYFVWNKLGHHFENRENFTAFEWVLDVINILDTKRQVAGLENAVHNARRYAPRWPLEWIKGCLYLFSWNGSLP